MKKRQQRLAQHKELEEERLNQANEILYNVFSLSQVWALNFFFEISNYCRRERAAKRNFTAIKALLGETVNTEAAKAKVDSKITSKRKECAQARDLEEKYFY